MMKLIKTTFLGLVGLALLVSGFTQPVLALEKITYYHTDGLGSPVAGSDENGNLLWKEDYKPFGERIRKETASDGNSRWFTGHPEDKETGFVYAGARHYDPVVGRFMAIDPVGFTEGNVQSFNRYAYVNNNPYKYRDPDGEYLDLAIEVVSISIGTASFVNNLSNGDYGGATLDALGVIADVALAVVPGVPGGVGLGIKAGREAAEAGVKKADFIVDSNGTAVRNSASGARKDLETGGFPGNATKETLENGTIHRGVPGKDGPMDVRIMDGQADGGAFKGPRIRTTRGGSANDGVRSDGSRFRNNENKSQRRKESHIRLDK